MNTSLLWFVGVTIILAMDARTDAMKLKDIEPQRCYQCDGAECDQLALSDLQTAMCPVERPYCATTCSAPDYHSTLSCAFKMDNPCTFTYNGNKISEMSCVCTDNLCNEPFSTEMKNGLLKFPSYNKIRNVTDLAKIWEFTYYHLIDENKPRDSNTFEIEDDTELATKEIRRAPGAMGPNDVTKAVYDYSLEARPYPRVSALQQETPEPSDDEEDDSESSGAGAVSVVDAGDELEHSTTESPAVPAPSSSEVPPKESVAQPLLFNFLTAIPLFYHFTV